MKEKQNKIGALICLAIIWGICYLLGALFSWGFNKDDWNTFSEIIFWGPSLLFTAWTINDYFINPND